MTRVIVVSNDVVPEMHARVAGPGIRAHGLAAGITSLGLDCELVVMADAVEAYEERAEGEIDRSSVAVVHGDTLQDFLLDRSPATVILINGNQSEHVEKHADLRYVLDLFAARHLEVAHLGSDGRTAEVVSRRLRKAFDLASAVTINGTKKKGYALAWLLDAGRDVAAMSMATVGPCLGHRFSDDVGDNLFIGGYMQAWGPLSPTAAAVAPLAEAGTKIDVVTGRHWGTRKSVTASESFTQLVNAPSVSVHEPMAFDRFRDLVGTSAAVVDLYPWSWERELSMSTRAVVAIASGTPVIHPPFTELSSYIDEYDAGWLVDPSDPDAVRRAVEEAVEGGDAAKRKRAGARSLATEQFAPAVAAAPLAAIVDGIW